MSSLYNPLPDTPRAPKPSFATPFLGLFLVTCASAVLVGFLIVSHTDLQSDPSYSASSQLNSTITINSTAQSGSSSTGSNTVVYDDCVEGEEFIVACVPVVPVIGDCNDFAVHGGAGVNVQGMGSVIQGNVGAGPEPNAIITGFGPLNLILDPYHKYTVGTTKSTQCVTSKLAAYAAAAGSCCTTELTTPDLAGLILRPGVYCSDSLRLGTGSLILDGLGSAAESFWIFQSASDIVTSVNTNIVLINGAQASNVYWQSGGSTSLGKDSTFKGTILAHSAIILDTGISFIGRALAKVESVSLAGGDTVLPFLDI